MTISLHTQTSAPNTESATSVSPLDLSGSSKTKFYKTKTDIYQTVTDNIIYALEAVVLPVAARTWYVRVTFKLRAKYCLQWNEYPDVMG